MESKYDCKKTRVNIFDQWGYKVGSREWGRWIYGERGIGEGLDKIAEPRITKVSLCQYGVVSGGVVSSQLVPLISLVMLRLTEKYGPRSLE